MLFIISITYYLAKTFQGPEEYVKSKGVEVIVLNDPECIAMMKKFITEKPSLWNEDIGL